MKLTKQGILDLGGSARKRKPKFCSPGSHNWRQLRDPRWEGNRIVTDYECSSCLMADTKSVEIGDSESDWV